MEFVSELLDIKSCLRDKCAARVLSSSRVVPATERYHRTLCSLVSRCSSALAQELSAEEVSCSFCNEEQLSLWPVIKDLRKQSFIVVSLCAWEEKLQIILPEALAKRLAAIVFRNSSINVSDLNLEKQSAGLGFLAVRLLTDIDLLSVEKIYLSDVLPVTSRGSTSYIDALVTDANGGNAHLFLVSVDIVDARLPVIVAFSKALQDRLLNYSRSTMPQRKRLRLLSKIENRWSLNIDIPLDSITSPLLLNLGDLLPLAHAPLESRLCQSEASAAGEGLSVLIDPLSVPGKFQLTRKTRSD